MDASAAVISCWARGRHGLWMVYRFAVSSCITSCDHHWWSVVSNCLQAVGIPTYYFEVITNDDFICMCKSPAWPASLQLKDSSGVAGVAWTVVLMHPQKSTPPPGSVHEQLLSMHSHTAVYISADIWTPLCVQGGVYECLRTFVWIHADHLTMAMTHLHTTNAHVRKPSNQDGLHLMLKCSHKCICESKWPRSYHTFSFLPHM